MTAFFLGNLQKDFPEPFMLLAALRRPRIEIQGLGFNGQRQSEHLGFGLKIGLVELEILFGGQPPFHGRFCNFFREVFQGNINTRHLGIQLDQSLLMKDFDIRQHAKKSFCRRICHSFLHGGVKIPQSRLEAETCNDGLLGACSP